MDLQLVKMSEKFKPQLLDMMDEWTKTGETIIPWAIRKADYHDFDAYLHPLFLHMTGNEIFWLGQSISDIPLTKHYCSMEVILETACVLRNEEKDTPQK